MRAQTEFFEENKERYRENLLQMERMMAQIKTAEALAEGHARAVREEVEGLDARINDSKWYQGFLLNTESEQERLYKNTKPTKQCDAQMHVLL